MKLMKVFDNNLGVKLQPVPSILAQPLVVKLGGHRDAPLLDEAQ